MLARVVYGPSSRAPPFSPTPECASARLLVDPLTLPHIPSMAGRVMLSHFRQASLVCPTFVPFLKVRVDNQCNIEADQKSPHAALLFEEAKKSGPAHDPRDYTPGLAEHRWRFPRSSRCPTAMSMQSLCPILKERVTSQRSGGGDCDAKVLDGSFMGAGSRVGPGAMVSQSVPTNGSIISENYAI